MDNDIDQLLNSESIHLNGTPEKHLVRNQKLKKDQLCGGYTLYSLPFLRL